MGLIINLSYISCIRYVFKKNSKITKKRHSFEHLLSMQVIVYSFFKLINIVFNPIDLNEMFLIYGYHLKVFYPGILFLEKNYLEIK